MRRTNEIIMLFVVAAGMTSYANGFRNPPEGAAAVGRVGGKIALAEDVSSISHNPANLTELKKPEAQVSVTMINTETEYGSLIGESKTEDPWKYLPNVFMAVPIENTRYTAGIGVTTPFGQSTVWDKESVFRYSAPYFAEMKVINLNPALAAKVNDKLSVAAGADLYWSRLDLKQVFPWRMVTGNALLQDGEIHMQGSGVGVGANAAMTLRPAPRHIVALTCRSPVTVDYDGETDFSGFPPGGEALGLSAESDFDTSIEFPAVIALGYAIKVTDRIRIEADVEWVQFSTYDKLELDAGINNPLMKQPGSGNPMSALVVPQNWEDSWTYGLGAEWDIRNDVTVRAGYIYLESPVPSESFAPTLPDASRHVLSCGAGVNRNGHRLDIGYGYSVIRDRDVDVNQNPAYAGMYETASHLMSVTYGYSF